MKKKGTSPLFGKKPRMNQLISSYRAKLQKRVRCAQGEKPEGQNANKRLEWQNAKWRAQILAPASRSLRESALPKNFFIFLKKTGANCVCLWYTIACQANWGISAAGSAFDWQSRGQGFDPPMLHHETNSRTLFGVRLFCIMLHRNQYVILHLLFPQEKRNL